MKFPLVSRKKYEVMKKNYELTNKQRRLNDEITINLQKQIIDKDVEIRNLKKENKSLKCKLTKLTKKTEVK